MNAPATAPRGTGILPSQSLRAMIARGDTVWVYVHESVPGASVDAYLPKELHRAWSSIEQAGRLARYALPRAALERWTRRARRALTAYTT